MRRSLLTVAVAALVLPILAAAHQAAAGKEMAKATDMQAQMVAEMMKCAVCKNFAAHWDELGPVTKMEAVKMNDGMAVVHTVTDPSKVALFHSTCEAVAKAGQACLTMTDEEAAKNLCSYCQTIRSTMKAGGQMHKGSTANGDIMVLTSSDPTVQNQINSLYEKCAMMAAMGTKPETATAATKQ